MNPTNWSVHKFGGTSVASAERMRGVVRVLEREPGARKAAVVSAMSGVTDALIALLEQARRRDDGYLAGLEDLKARHLAAVRELLPEAERPALERVLEEGARDVGVVLRTAWLGRGYSEQTLELVAGHGELWSAQMLAAYLRALGRSVAYVDARQVLVVTPGEIGPVVDWETSRRRLDRVLAEHPAADWLVITGYVAATPDGVPTTLKRNGSDFSGSIFGVLLDSSAVTIWTDVDGVLSADPRRVPEAVVLDEISYDEAMELAYFGAKILHPRTMAPAVAHGIPIFIRNTFNPTFPGTRIHAPAPAGDGPARGPVKGFATVDGVALLNVEGTGMVGVPGVAQRLFGALREVGVSVVLISQASSEHSICFAVPEAQAEQARAVVERAFAGEMRERQIAAVSVVGGCSIIAAVGDGMANVPGVAAEFFSALATAGVNVRAIAQGSSERNISAVIDRKDGTRALRAVHFGFYLSDQVLSVGVVGAGLVGRELLRQLHAQAPVLREQFGIDLRVRGVMTSQRMTLAEGRLDLGAWLEAPDAGARPADLAAFVDHVQTDYLPHSVIIDCTADEAVAGEYARWLARGIHVVTPNKKAGAGPLERYVALQRLGRERRTHFFYEATVGAGLPVISTLRDLVQTGDQVVQIEGVLSGTLSYVFNSFVPGVAFSEVVREARRRGYTEPDPRDDLSGMDVARKVVILAREAGLPLELADVRVDGLVPEALRACATADEFLERLPSADAQMAALLAEARARDEVLRYVGVVTAEGRAAVELRRYPATHPFARVTGSDNIILFKTTRYHDQPLVVQGPGAGPAVTAGGVFADLLRLANYLGRRPEARERLAPGARAGVTPPRAARR